MKLSKTLLIVVACAGCSVFAQDGIQTPTAPTVSAFKKKFACTQRFVAKIFNKDGKLIQDIDENDSSNEGVMTIWKVGNIEFRFTEGIDHFDKNETHSRSLAKITRNVKNKLTVEDGEVDQVTNYAGTGITSQNGEQLVEKRLSYESVLEDLGDGRKKITKSKLNGATGPAASIKSQYGLPDGTIVIVTLDQTPYSKKLGNGYREDVSLSQEVCHDQILK